MKTSFNRLKIFLIVLLGLSFFSIELYADSVPGAIKELERQINSHPNDTEALWELGMYYLNTDRLQDAKNIGERLKSLSKTNKGRHRNLDMKGDIVIGISLIPTDPEKAFRYLEKSKIEAMAKGDRQSLLRINEGLGQYYLLRHNDTYTATSYYYAALEDAKAIGDKIRYSILQSKIADCYLINKDMTGEEIAEEALSIARELNDPIALYKATKTLADYRLISKDAKDAQRLIEESERFHSASGMKGESRNHLLRGRLYALQNDKPRAYEEYQKAINKFDSIDDSSISEICLAYARFLEEDDKFDEAANMLHKAMRRIALDSAVLRVHTPELLNELIEVCIRTREYTQALSHSYNYRHHLDTVYKIGRARTLQENRIKNEVFLNQYRIAQQKAELKEKNLRIVLLCSGLALVVAILIFVYVNYRRKDRYYRQIVLQNTESLRREEMLKEQIDHLRKEAESKPGKEDDESSSKSQATSDTSERETDLVNRFNQMMAEEKLYTDPNLTLNGMAERLSTNRTYLSRALNGKLSRTFTQIINDFRIREAIRLITDGDPGLPLKQICADIGYNSMSTFYSMFQQTTGMTPAKYRNYVKNMN